MTAQSADRECDCSMCMRGSTVHCYETGSAVTVQGMARTEMPCAHAGKTHGQAVQACIHTASRRQLLPGRTCSMREPRPGARLWISYSGTTALPSAWPPGCSVTVKDTEGGIRRCTVRRGCGRRHVACCASACTDKNGELALCRQSFRYARDDSPADAASTTCADGMRERVAEDVLQDCPPVSAAGQGLQAVDITHRSSEWGAAAKGGRAGNSCHRIPRFLPRLVWE